MSTGARIGARIGARVGARVAAPPVSLVWTKDATSLVAIPQTATEVASLLSGIAPGSAAGIWMFGDAAAGDVVDRSGSGRNLVPEPTGTYTRQQAVAGWASQSLRTTEGVKGFLTATIGNVNANNYTLYMWAFVAAPSNFRALMHMGDVFDASTCIEIDNAPHVLLGRGTGAARTVGASNPTAAMRPWVLVNEGGVDARAYTNQEELSGAPVNSSSGTELKVGGDNTDSWFPATTDYVYAMLINAAHTTAQVRAVLQRAAWTVLF